MSYTDTNTIYPNYNLISLMQQLFPSSLSSDPFNCKEHFFIFTKYFLSSELIAGLKHNSKLKYAVF